LKEAANLARNSRNGVTADFPNGLVQKNNDLMDFGEIIDVAHNRKLRLLRFQM
jgi:hypothetical protein